MGYLSGAPGRVAAARTAARARARTHAQSPAAARRSALQRAAERTVSLPTFPAVASRLIEEVARPDATSEEIGRIVALDPALTARTLRLANSDFYGFPRKVGSVELAAVVLGAATIRDLVLTASVARTVGCSGAALEGLLSHSMAAGIAARALAERTQYRLTGDAYAAGLLHDVGKVVLRESDPSRFDQAMARCRSKGVASFEAERALFGSDHAEVGGWLAERWGLPADIVEAIACHHRPETAARNRALTSLVHVADALAQRAGYPATSGCDVPGLDGPAWEEVEPHAARRQALAAELASEVIRETEREKALFAEFRGSGEE